LEEFWKSLFDQSLAFEPARSSLEIRLSIDAYDADLESARLEGTVGLNVEHGIAEHLRTLDRDALLPVLERVPGVVLRPLLPRDAGTE
jgi:hypothetical protein